MNISIEEKWQKKWEKAKIFEADPKKGAKKYFITFPYPYVNSGPHIGHFYSYFRAEAMSRFKRMQGFNVLFPQGFHATGEPIVGAIKRIRMGEKKLVDGLKESGATDADIERFKKEGEKAFVEFWVREWKSVLKKMGSGVDWRRSFVTTPLTPTYSRFIEWQYNSLKKKGYVVQGSHPVIYCPKCNSPTGDHDRLKGEGETVVEYSLIKFLCEFEGKKIVLPAATLRPETTFGVTNMWLKPSEGYVLAEVDGEKWIVSEEAAKKLADQLKKVKVLRKVNGRELIGKKCLNPLTKKEVLVLPAEFVSLENATGAVMSVPAHAPYDYIALENLKKNDSELKKFGLKKEEIEKISPIKLIETPDFKKNDFPARQVCLEMNVKSQGDPKLEEATALVYKKEFHKGRLNENCGKFKGLSVADCKDSISDALKKSGAGDEFYECSSEVICRCTAKCHVKIVENQWFLAYSNEEWKEKVRKHLKKMKILPEDARPQFENTIDWLKDKACTRQSGLGTPLPWDKQWIVETLSDSVIYMAYYTIAKTINENKISAGQLSDEAFDYVFYGKGSANEICKKSGLKKELLEEMKEQFDCFYPLDLRSTAKDLLQNHMTFSLFHHCALFPGKEPRAYAINGYVLVEGEKMSKSRGNMIPATTLLRDFGADLTRINMVSSAENMEDADWRSENVKTFRKNLLFIESCAEKAVEKRGKGKASKKDEKGNGPDFWASLLENRAQECVNNYLDAMEEMRFRTAIYNACFEGVSGLKTYCDCSDEINPQILKENAEKILLMLAPFAPHFCEEQWEKLGNKEFISISRMPGKGKVKKSVLEEHRHAKKTAEDARNLVELVERRGTNAKSATFVVAPKWMFDAMKSASAQARENNNRIDFAKIAKETRQDEKTIKEFCGKAMSQIHYFKQNGFPEFNEFKSLETQKRMLEAEVNAGRKEENRLSVKVAEFGEKNEKTERARPFKPSIVVE